MIYTDKQLKSYLILFAATALIPIVFFGMLGFVIQPVSGDLTRLGKLAERDFGWNDPQPIMPILSSNFLAKPDVIVLGDSFSEPNVWQTLVMQNTKLNLLTFSHLTMRKPECIEQWLRSLPNRYPSAKTIVIETTEKSFLARFTADQNTCKRPPLEPHTITAWSTAANRPSSINDVMPDPIYGLRAAASLWKKFDKATKSADTIVEPLSRSDLFSSRRSDLLLYYKDDLILKRLDPQIFTTATKKILALQQIATQSNLRLLITVVPDKSSIYSRFFKTPPKEIPASSIEKAMREDRINNIDLFTPFNANVEKIKDLYLSNDTHLSTRGYRLMGEVIAKALSNN
jgi:SGNH hydrolase-like domain, acetyltransferase AlgX